MNGTGIRAVVAAVNDDRRFAVQVCRAQQLVDPRLHPCRVGVGSGEEVALADRGIDVVIEQAGRGRDRHRIAQRSAGAQIVHDVDAAAGRHAIGRAEDHRQRCRRDRHRLVGRVRRGEGESAKIVEHAETAVGVAVRRGDRGRRQCIKRRMQHIGVGLPSCRVQDVQRFQRLPGGISRGQQSLCLERCATVGRERRGDQGRARTRGCGRRERRAGLVQIGGGEIVVQRPARPDQGRGAAR